jgi:threonine/homoserine/homoserine lactone efflux protein
MLHRLFLGVFGLLLMGVGIYALFSASPFTILQLAGGSALVLLGGNMVVSAWRARESWLSRLGPLP